MNTRAQQFFVIAFFLLLLGGVAPAFADTLSCTVMNTDPSGSKAYSFLWSINEYNHTNGCTQTLNFYKNAGPTITYPDATTAVKFNKTGPISNPPRLTIYSSYPVTIQSTAYPCVLGFNRLNAPITLDLTNIMVIGHDASGKKFYGPDALCAANDDLATTATTSEVAAANDEAYKNVTIIYKGHTSTLYQYKHPYTNDDKTGMTYYDYDGDGWCYGVATGTAGTDTGLAYAANSYDSDKDGFCEGYYKGYSNTGVNLGLHHDCDETKATVNPEAGEIAGDQIDSNCDGKQDPVAPTPQACIDGDHDGSSVQNTTSGAPSCTIATAELDCNDSNSAIHPGAAEIPDKIDNNCNSEIDEGTANRDDDHDEYCPPTDAAGIGNTSGNYDSDDDGLCDKWYDVTKTDKPAEDPSKMTDAAAIKALWSNGQWDCKNDADYIKPGILDYGNIPADSDLKNYNEIDNDCDGKTDEDGLPPDVPPPACVDIDEDGYQGQNTAPGVPSCTAPTNGLGVDCDDTNPDIYPGITEVCDGKDNNCDGTIDEGFDSDKTTYYSDGDGDGYGDNNATLKSCDAKAPAKYSLDNTDCDDSSGSIYPGAAKDCDSSKDNDCNGTVDNTEDACKNSDGDKYLDVEDNCKTTVNDDQTDSDHDGVGNACDACPNDSNKDHQTPETCTDACAGFSSAAQCAACQDDPNSDACVNGSGSLPFGDSGKAGGCSLITAE